MESQGRPLARLSGGLNNDRRPHISFLLDDRDRPLDEIRQRDIKIAELERAISLRDQLITIEEGER